MHPIFKHYIKSATKPVSHFKHIFVWTHKLENFVKSSTRQDYKGLLQRFWSCLILHSLRKNILFFAGNIRIPFSGRKVAPSNNRNSWRAWSKRISAPSCRARHNPRTLFQNCIKFWAKVASFENMQIKLQLDEAVEVHLQPGHFFSARGEGGFWKLKSSLQLLPTWKYGNKFSWNLAAIIKQEVLSAPQTALASL